MSIAKKFLFLLLISLSESHVLQQFLPIMPSNITTNASFTQTLGMNTFIMEVLQENSTSIFSESETAKEDPTEVVFDNDYAEKITKKSDVTAEEFHPGPYYEVNWTNIDKETVRVVFSLFSIFKKTNEKIVPNKNERKINKFPTVVSIPSPTIETIHSLRYYLFTIRQHKTKMENVGKMEQLALKNTPSRLDEHFSNSLLLLRLNPKEKYAICIYYYQMNISTRMPDLFICQDVMHDHSKHPEHGLVFILTQYSIIFGMLIVLQALFSMRKRRIAHTVHRRLIDGTQKFRRSFSSFSIARQSFSYIDADTERPPSLLNGPQNSFKKRITSSPAIISNHPVISPTLKQYSSGENEPFLQLTSGKSHVHFLIGLDEGSDDNQSNSTLDPQIASPLSEPYSDRADALQSMAHILDTNRPWLKHKSPGNDV